MMKPIKTERLILRQFTEDDFDAVHSYASLYENTIYMQWGPNDESETRAFIKNAIDGNNKRGSEKNFYFAVTLKDSGGFIGACDIPVRGSEATLGWILHIDQWNE